MNFDRSWLEKTILRDDNNRRILDIREEFTVVNKGENFMSEVSRVTVKCMTGSGTEAEYSLIVKKVPDSDAMRLFHKEFGLFEVEVRAYSEILGGMEELMRINGDCREYPWCQIKGYLPGNAIALEDLTTSGYQKLKKRDLLDEEHAVHVLNELSRFHAMGLALIAQNVINPVNLKPPPVFDERIQKIYYVPALAAIRDAVRTTWGSTWSDLLNPLDQINENLCEIIKQLEERKSFNVIAHGDCWTGNFMFKTDFRGKILSMKFIDFQFMGCSSFALDLCVFLKNSVRSEVRLTKLDHLLQVYHDNLKANAEYFHVNADSIPTLSEVKNTVESVEIFSFVIMCIYFPLIGDDTGVKISDAFDEKHETSAVFRAHLYSTEECKRVSGQELRRLIAKGCFEKGSNEKVKNVKN